jgi:hypothetical protein
MGFKGTPSVASSDINHEYSDFPMMLETIHTSETAIYQSIRARNKKEMCGIGVRVSGLRIVEKEGIYKEKSEEN